MSKRPSFAVLAFLCAVGVSAQPNLPPVIDQRGVINGYSQAPAPSTVAPGGIIWIRGLNLGPAAGVSATTLPLPLELGDPPIRVMINARPAPLLSADPSRIVAQVPLEVAAGLANIVVQKNGTNSRPARIMIVPLVPSVLTSDESGFGELQATRSGNQITFRASGLGVTEPRLGNGEAATAGTPARPRANFDVHVGGILTEPDIRASTTTPGEFDITITLPETVQPGDLVAVSANGRLSNLATYRKGTQVETTFVPMPAGAPDVRTISGSDLRGGFFVASAARTDGGCWPSVLFDLQEKSATNLGGCLSAAARAALTPAVPTVDGAPLAAFVGPPQGDGTAGQPVSNKVMVFNPSRRPMAVDLPIVATQLAGVDSTTFAAVMGGTPPQVATINTVTGEVGSGTAGLGGLAGGGAGAGGGGAVIGQGGGGALNPANLKVDLGGGLDKVLTAPFALAPGQNVVVVGDDSANPTKAKLAVLNQQAEVTATRDFPDGWLPVVMPPAAAAGGGGQGGGGLGGGGVVVGPGGLPGGGGGGGLAALFRVGTYLDAQTRTMYLVSRKSDDSASGVVAVDATTVKAIAAPAKYYVAACTNVAQNFAIETSRRVIFYGTNTPAREFQRVCGALSFLALDLATQQFTAIDLPGNGQVNASDQGFDINDFVLAASTGGDTLFAVDGVTLTSYRFDLPQGVVGFAGLQPYPQLGLVVATGRARAAGDAGFLIFDLERVETRQLLLPDAFAAVLPVGVLPATRKLVARGTKAGNTTSQFLVYDLQTGEVTLVDNPTGVVWVAQVPQQPAQPGGQPGQGQQAVAPMQRLNQKANTLEAITFSGDRRANGAMLVRIP